MLQFSRTWKKRQNCKIFSFQNSQLEALSNSRTRVHLRVPNLSLSVTLNLPSHTNSSHCPLSTLRGLPTSFAPLLDTKGSVWNHGLPFSRSFALSYSQSQLLVTDISRITVFTVRCVAIFLCDDSARHQRICVDSRSTMFAAVQFILHATPDTHARSLSRPT